MSIDQKELKIRLKAKRNRGVVGGLLALEFVLSIVLCISLAAQIIWPQISGAAGTVGTPLLLNYEGYLTDSSNNPLGGSSGVQYCFHFSIYSAVSGGSKLWPSASPSVTAATATNGVFNAVIGQADAFASTTFDFSTTSTAYLQVDVNTTTGSTCTSSGTYQSLSPRQQILSSGYSLNANNVSGQLLDTNEAPTGSSTVQVGLGAGGSANPVYLGLDIKNIANQGDYVGSTCSVNGLVWYDSATSHILSCIGGFVQSLDNNGSTTTIASIITPYTSATASTGGVYFSNANNMSFGLNGQTLTASGLGNAAMTAFVPSYPLGTTSQTMGTLGATTGSVWFFPFQIQHPMSFNVVRMMESASWASSAVVGSQTISSAFGIYSNNAGTLSLISSNSFYMMLSNSSVSATFSYASATSTSGYGYTSVGLTTTANIQSSFGTNAYRIVGMQFGNTMSLPAGAFWLGMLERQSTAGFSGGLSTAYIGNSLNSQALSGIAGFGDTINSTNFTLRAPWGGFGVYTSTYSTNVMPSSAYMSGIAQTISVMPLMTFVST